MDDPLRHPTFGALEAALNTQKDLLNAYQRFLTRLHGIQASLAEFERDVSELGQRSPIPDSANLIADFRAHVTAQLEDHAQVDGALQQLRQDLEQEKLARQKADEIVLRLEKDLGEQSAATEAARERVAKIEIALADAEAKHTDIDSLRQAHDDLIQNNSTLNAELETLRDALKQQEIDAAESQNRLKEATLHQDDLKSELETLRRSLEQASAGAADARTRAQLESEQRHVLEAQLHDAREATNQEAAARHAAEQELETLKQRLADLEQRLAALPAAEQFQQLQRDLDAERERAEQLQQRVDEELSKGTKSMLAAQLAQALQEAEEAREQCRALKKELGKRPPDAVSQTPPAPESALPAQPLPVFTVEELEARIDTAAKTLGSGRKISLGELLLSAGLLRDEQLAQALDEQKRSPQKHLGAILIEKDFAGQEAVALALSFQCGAPFVKLEEQPMDRNAVTLLNGRLAHQHACIPVREKDDALLVAMVNPIDLVAIEDIERATNRKVEVLVATERDIRAALDKFYWGAE